MIVCLREKDCTYTPSLEKSNYLSVKLMVLWVMMMFVGAWGTTYYVDFLSGVDTQNGQSPAAAWKHSPGDTVATSIAAAATLAAGDTVLFKGGVVYQGKVDLKWSGAQNNTLVYDGNSANAWGTGKAVIDGENLRYYGLFASTTGIHDVTISFFEIRNQIFQTGAAWVGGNGIRLQDCSRIIVANCYLHDMGYWNNDGSVTPAGCGVSMVKPSNCLITGCDITKTGGSGVGLVGAQDCIISHNNIHDYINWGIDLGGDYQLCTRNVICDNTIHDLYRYDNGFWGGSGEPPHQDFIFIRMGSGTHPLFNVVERNLFYNNYDFTDNGGTAMTFLSYADSTIIRNNVYINAHSFSTASFGWTSAGTRFYNNTIYCPRTGTVRLTSNGNNDIRNNLIVGSGGINLENSTDELGLVADYNCYNISNDAHAFTMTKPYTAWTYAAWQGRGYDIHSHKAAAIADLKFVNTSGYPLACQTMDLHLLSGSPAIGTGVDLSSRFTTDKDGVTRPVGSGWDVGAYEYVSTEVGRLKDESRNIIENGSITFPNPISVSRLNRYLKNRQDVMVCNLAGQVVNRRCIDQPGIYIIGNKKGANQKNMVVK